MKPVPQSDGLSDDPGAFVPGPRCFRPKKRSGPLDGLRVAVKDLIDVEGAITGGGNPDWQLKAKPALQDAIAVMRLRQAGAAIIGKTITDELAFSLEGENAHYGTPRNPKAPDRLPGGSSSGSAVAVAAGLADAALGTDTGGSVRVPASFCGIPGFRPTHGRVPLTGVIPFAPSFDTVGFFAKDGEVMERFGLALLDGVAASPPTRYLLARDAFALADPRAQAELRQAAKMFPLAGEIDLFDHRSQDWLESYRVLQGAEIWASLGPWIERTAPQFGDSIAPRFRDAASITAADVARWQPFRAEAALRLRQRLPRGTALILPSAPSIALRRDASSEERGAFYRAALALGAIAGHAGLPQLSLPLAELDGCPLGLSFIAGSGADESLLALAALP